MTHVPNFFSFICLAVPIWGFGLLATIFWIWVLVDALMNEPSEYKDKLLWVLVIIFTHFIGAVLYLIIRRPHRRAEYGK
jgi:hypothetical protein